MENSYGYPGGPEPGPGRKFSFDGKRIKRIAIIAAIAIFVAGLAFSCWYTVDDKQECVVTTFGRVTDVTEAGIHFKLPFGIQQSWATVPRAARPPTSPPWKTRAR